jgi:hypothetical protein
LLQKSAHYLPGAAGTAGQCPLPYRYRG